MGLLRADAAEGRVCAERFLRLGLFLGEEKKTRVRARGEPPGRAASCRALTFVMVMLMICVVRRRAERVLQPESRERSPRELALPSSLDCVRLGMGVK